MRAEALRRIPAQTPCNDRNSLLITRQPEMLDDKERAEPDRAAALMLKILGPAFRLVPAGQKDGESFAAVAKAGAGERWIRSQASK